MSPDKPIWIGADPGGLNHFGIAVLSDGLKPIAKCVSCADEAVAFVQENIDREPSGVGVDAPLWWTSGAAGSRQADCWLRKRYGLSGGEVQSTNSLRGAALTQAAMFLQRIREIYPDVPVTESHPKALLKVLTRNDWRRFTERFGLIWTDIENHQQDALIAAVCAREGFQGRWDHDLSINRFPSEQDPQTYWLAPVHYFWPEE